jgi:hypothetical protein
VTETLTDVSKGAGRELDVEETKYMLGHDIAQVVSHRVTTAVAQGRA